MSRRKQILNLAAFSASLFGLAAHADADSLQWVGGNVNWTNTNALDANWNNLGAGTNHEPLSTDIAIFNGGPNSVSLAAANIVAGLTLTNSNTLNLAGFNLTVNGLTSVSGAGTTLLIPTGSILDSDTLTLSSPGVVLMQGGTITSSGRVNVNGVLSGNGRIILTANVTAPTDLIVNNVSTGTLTATSTSPGDLFGTAAATLTIHLNDVDGRVNLDQVSSVINVSRNDSLVIQGTLSDPFSSTINLAEGATLNISTPWSIDSLANINVNTGSIFIGNAGAAAHIDGGSFTQTGGNITLNPIDTLQFDSLFTMSGGTLTNNGKVIFGANSTIGSGAHFTMTDFSSVSASSSLQVLAGVTVTVNQADFNLDAVGSATNLLTIESGGVLTVNIGAGGDNGVGSTILLNGGTLNLNSSTAGEWFLNRTVTTGVSTGVSAIGGDTVTISGATITVANGSTLRFNAGSTWNASSTFVVNAGGVLILAGTTSFTGTGSFTGAGTLRTPGNTTFSGSTTINMTGGSVDLDGSDFIGNSVTISGSTITFNIGTMQSFGGTLIGNDSLNISFGNLVVNLDTATSWTLTADAFLNINVLGGALGGGGIGGTARFIMNGVANITGNSEWTGPTTIGGTITIAAGGGSSLNLFGGDTGANINRLAGGTITGGLVNSLSNEGLAGFGLINSSISFNSTTVLLADDGTMTLTGQLVHVGTLGTNDVDGVLNITSPWNTNVTNAVVLKGGTLTGSAITHSTGSINGFGVISSLIVNNGTINANVAGQTLVLNNAASDWDGSLAPEIGTLRATNGGTLEVVDNAGFAFNGTVIANTGGTVFANGFNLSFSPSANLTLNNGTYRLNTSSTFGGHITVNGASASTIHIDGAATADLTSTGITTLSASLNLDGGNFFIHAGATVNGGGQLFVLAGTQLGIENNETIGVQLNNSGTLNPGGAVVGTPTVPTYVQSFTGSLVTQLGGSIIGQYDRLNVTGISSVNGNLTLQFTGGFAPNIGDQFIVLSSPGGVIGTFATITPPAPLVLSPAPLLLLNFVFTPTYNPNNVIVTVTKAAYEVQSGLYPQNFTGSGYEVWKTTSGTATLTGNSTFSGPTTAFAGKLIVAHQNALGTNGLNIQPGAVVQLSGALAVAVKLSQLNIAGAPNAWTGQLDLTNSAGFILQTAGGAGKTAAITTLLNQINQGRNGGLWNGQGITASTIPSTPNTALALADNADLGLLTYKSQSVNGNSLILVQAHIGDATLDGKVDSFDLNVLAAHWQQPAGALWSAGDFTGDGKVDAFDLNALAANWQFGVPLEAALAAFPVFSSPAAVPEPASLAVLGMGALLLGRRHRRR